MNTIDNLAHTDSLEMLAMQSDIHDIPEYNPTLKETLQDAADDLLFFVPVFFLFGVAAYAAAYLLTTLVFLFL